MAKNIVAERQVTIHFACLCMNVSETCYRYQARLSTKNELIADWLIRLTQAHKRWGFSLCFMHLRNVKGFAWNHKRVYRIYRELELNLRIKPSRRTTRDRPDPLAVPTKINQVWSVYFMSDGLDNGSSYSCIGASSRMAGQTRRVVL